MISFDFDRIKTKRRLTLYMAAVLGGLAFMFLSWDLSLFGVIGQGWGWVILVLALFVATHSAFYAQWIGILGRGLRRSGAAIVVNQYGIVDNASDYILGQLTWAEIEKMYSCDWKTRLITDRWKRMPVLTKERGVVIILKDDVDFETRLRGKSWIIKPAFKEKFKRGREHWVFVPDVLLTVTADELMVQLNRFYVTEVRGTA